MKIFFFKNETHFHLRISYVWENAEKVNISDSLQRAKKYLMWILSVPLLIFVFLSLDRLTVSPWCFHLILFLTLPAHEFCHALFCLIAGRKVERICFFPYKQVLKKPIAYVMPSFGAWTKGQAILFFAFPLHLQTILPAVMAIFLSSLRFWLLFLSLYNLSTSAFDIVDILNLMRLPKRAIYFDSFSLLTKNDRPIIIHRLSVTPALDGIRHQQFEYCHSKLTEKEQICETPETERLRQEFIEQFHLESQ